MSITNVELSERAYLRGMTRKSRIDAMRSAAPVIAADFLRTLAAHWQDREYFTRLDLIDLAKDIEAANGV